MAERKPEWPKAGDTLIGTVKAGTDYGACAQFDEYNPRGLLRVSEQGTFRREK
jgi:translation initiation factor 2 alpha subunit (eIF-2alpha)